MTIAFVHRSTALMALVSLVIAPSVWAGNLTPPPGPVTPTMKPLDEVEPCTALTAATTPGNSSNVFIIWQPGSYYLTGNLHVSAGQNGILIGTPVVTIDLRGFTIIGDIGSLAGITTNGTSESNITIKNGAVVACGGNGVDLSYTWASLVTGVTTYNNGGNGVLIAAGSRADQCTAFNNGQAGFASGGNSSFTNCSSTYNTTGFLGFGSNDRFEHCMATINTGIGFNLASDTTIRDCSSLGNTYQGIACNGFCTITGNQCRDNGGTSSAGIWVQGSASRVEGNDLSNNGFGIYVSGTNNIIVRNAVEGSSQSNYYIVPGNHVGVIVQPTSTSTLINGNSGGGMGTTDPNANFAH